jgi:hypothetical protein
MQDQQDDQRRIQEMSVWKNTKIQQPWRNHRYMLQRVQDIRDGRRRPYEMSVWKDAEIQRTWRETVMLFEM